MKPSRAFLIAWVILTSGSVVGGPASARHAQVAVDLVTLKSGRTIRGVIVRVSPDGSLVMAVSRDWLHKANPELLGRHQKTEAATRKTALEQLRDRIKQAAVGVADDSRLGAFLRSEAKRVERLQDDPNPPDQPRFVWLDLTKKEIARIKPASKDNRRISGWSWSEGLPNVETRDARDLARELQRRGIHSDRPLPDLSDQFPIRTQDDGEWSARLALIVYALHKPLEFQGTGDQLIPIDRSAKAQDAAPLISKLPGTQVNTLFKDLLGDPRSTTPNAAANVAANAAANMAAKMAASDDWLKTARIEAERQRLRAFRATRVDLNLSGEQAAVDSVFAVRLDKGNWQVIWSAHESGDAAKQRPEVETTIADDPQVKSALASLKALGVGADDQIRRAIRYGAATLEAQKAVDRGFFAFEEPLLRHLDGPPLWW
jgi:hypothetical protein